MDKKTADFLRATIKARSTGVRNRALIPPKSKHEAIKKLLCTKIIGIIQESKLSQQAVADLAEIERTTISFIMNYHIEKLSMDTLIKVLESFDSKESNSTLKKIAVVLE